MGRGLNSNKSRHYGKYGWTFYPRKTPIDEEMLAKGKEYERLIADILVDYGFDEVIDISERTCQTEEGTVWCPFDLLVTSPYYSFVADVKYRYRKSPISMPLSVVKYQSEFPLDVLGVDEGKLSDRLYIFCTPLLPITFLSLKQVILFNGYVERHIPNTLPTLRKILEHSLLLNDRDIDVATTETESSEVLTLATDQLRGNTLTMEARVKHPIQDGLTVERREKIAGERFRLSLEESLRKAAAYQKNRREVLAKKMRQSPSTYKRLSQEMKDRAKRMSQPDWKPEMEGWIYRDGKYIIP